MSNKFQKIGLVLILTMLMLSCADKKETPESIAARWCELNAQVAKATEGTEKTKALTARKEFETSMETKHNKDTAMMQAIFQAVKTCEAASESMIDKTAAGAAITDVESLLPMASADAVATANAYCMLIDQSIHAAQRNDADLNQIVSTKVIFEKNMDESYRNNPERRDSIFKLIEPCIAKEVQFNRNSSTIK